MMKRTAVLFFLLSMLISGPVATAAVDDIRILVDVSGSMVKTDPQNLRIPAVKMLNGLIPSGSSAGLWTFGRYVSMEVKWGKVDEKWRKRADAGVDKIHSRGQFTNIEGALTRASASWKTADPNSRRNIILLTDGQVDISKNAEKNELSRSNILNKTLPQLVKKGVTVHTIALSGYSDESLLKQIAVKTSGSFEIANSAEDLQRIFLRMFERAAKPDTVPLNNNSFSVDNSIREMTLLVFRQGDRKTRLIQPDGKVHIEEKHAANVQWRNDLGYDLITVKKPLSGKWKLDADVDPDNRVMVVTDLKLVVNDLPAYTTPDKALDIKVELQSKNKKISKNSFLKFVDFSLTHRVEEDTVTTRLQQKKSRETSDKGIYLQRIDAPLREGNHELIISADARVFDRSKRFNIEVQWPVKVDIEKGKKPGEFELRIQAREEYIVADSLQLEVVLQRPDGLQKPLIMALQNGEWNSQIMANELDGLHPLLIRVKATSVHGEPVDHKLDGYSVLGVKFEPQQEVKDDTVEDPAANEKEPEAATMDEDENDNGLMTTLIIIVALNVVFVLIAGGVYFYLRKKKLSNEEYDLFAENDELDLDAGDKKDD